MSTQPEHYPDDTPRRDRSVVPVAVTRSPRETMRSSTTTPSEPLVSSRSAAYPHTTSHVASQSMRKRSLSVSGLPRDAQRRLDVGRDGTEHRIMTATLSKDQGAMYASRVDMIKMRDPDPESRPSRERVRRPYDGDRADDKRDTLRTGYYSSPKENNDIHTPPLAHAKGTEPIDSASAHWQHLCDAQSKELDFLRRERRVAVEEQRKLASEYESLRQRCDERSRKLESVRAERQEARTQCQEITDAYKQLRQQYKEQANELEHVRRDRQGVLWEMEKLEEEYNALADTLHTERNECYGLRHKCQSLRAKLKERNTELQGVQKFAMTADTFSGTEVVGMLKKLNAEVQQNATFMAEWAEKFIHGTPPTDQMNIRTIDRTRTSEILGMKLMQLLGTKKHTVLVEMALRAYLIYELHGIATQGAIREEEHSHKMYIDAIYQRMQDAEGQAISGNWRALTRAYTLPARTIDPQLAHNIAMTIVSGFSEILLAAGCTAPKADITSALCSKFLEKIHRFVSLAGEVNETIGVGVVSENYEVQAVRPNTIFDKEVMEDSDDDGDRMRGRENREELVLCATELGLVQQMKVGADAGQNGERLSGDVIIMKPKVALESVIDMLSE